MHIDNLLEQACHTYGLDEARKPVLRQRLSLAGFESEIPTEDVSMALDLLLSDVVHTANAAAVAKGPRLALPQRSLCPRCNRPMDSAGLKTSGVVDYCGTCRIAIPV